MPTKNPETYFAPPELAAARAIYRGDAAGTRQAVTTQHINPNYVSPQGMTLLIFALANRQHACVQALLELGADPNLPTRLGGTKLTQPVALVAGGEDTELLRLLLAAKGDPNSKEGDETAISQAIHGRRFEHLRLLLDHGADLNAVEGNGMTPVLMLAVFNQFEQVAYLIERGADFRRPSNSGATVAYIVQDHVLTDHNSEAYQWQQRVRRLLEERGVQFPVPNPAAANGQKRNEVARYRQQWLQQPEGRGWRARIDAAGNDTDRFRLRLDAQRAFHQWLQTQLPPDHELVQYELKRSQITGIEGF
ncbi:ankyrin repeat domain-containing protein [Hymenobacter sp. CRA2]|uniref:ankyrin repeat domain-containing protein n=1 Tax=Hymenobacter sp. CRA2 TaxID=1955620 RepID=UPI0009D4FE98|nr:ankyrin repeat domain-containing protein [Hymenobacter sp. CRA2]OON69100.1 hypothetical protein B0919_10345 [Hymenobacter sp. CRA2]